MHSFKRTLPKILAFLLSIVIVTMIVVEPYYQNEVYHYQDDAVRTQLAGTLDTLICGSSHAYYGVVPTVLDEKLGTSSYNLSASMMTMAGRYELLKKEMERNEIEFVILDASYNSLSRNREKEGPEGDIYQLGRYRNPMERLSYFFRHFSLDEYARTYSDTLTRGLTSIRKLLHDEGKLGSSDKYETRGWMRGESTPQPVVAPEDYHTEIFSTQIDESCKYYLDEIMALCQAHNVAVVVVVTPISQYATLRYDNLDYVHSYWADYCMQKGIAFFDFNLYRGKTERFSDMSAFYDESHLSEQAAPDFTDLLCDVILKWRAGEDTSGWFYTSYAEAEEAALAGADVMVE